MLRNIYLDSCAVLNVYATRRFQEILVANGAQDNRHFVVAERVVAESMYVRDGISAQEPVNLQPAVDVGLLDIEHIQTDEEAATFVSLAGHLDDGEAETAALAYHRGGDVVTDDLAARRALSSLRPFGDSDFATVKALG